MAETTASKSVRDYARLFFRRKWGLVLPALAGLALAALVWARVPPVPHLLPTKYRAVAVVRRKDLALLGTAPSSLIARGQNGVSLNALRVEILTWTNLDRVIRQINMDVGLKSAEDWQRQYRELQDTITVNPAAQGRGIDLVEIAVTHESPKMAARIANALAHNYIEESKRTLRGDSRTAVEFLEEGRDEYLEQVRKLEAQMEKYREKHFADLPNVKDGILSRLLELQMQLTSHSLQLAEARNQLSELASQLEETELTVRSEVTTEDNPRARELEEKITQAKRLLSDYLLRYTEEHPSIKQFKARIAEMKGELAETEKRITGSEREIINPLYQELMAAKLDLERRIRGHEAAVEQVEADIRANEETMRALVAEEDSYQDLLREYNEASEFYDTYRRSLVAHRTRLQVEEGERGTQVEMMASALEPVFPYRLAYGKVMFALIIGGMAAGVGLVVALEYCDRSFRDMEDASGYLGIPVLGSICTIVTAGQVARRRRRRRIVLAGFVLVALVACGGGLYVWHLMDPGAPSRFLALMKEAVVAVWRRMSA